MSFILHFLFELLIKLAKQRSFNIKKMITAIMHKIKRVNPGITIRVYIYTTYNVSVCVDVMLDGFGFWFTKWLRSSVIFLTRVI